MPRRQCERAGRRSSLFTSRRDDLPDDDEGRRRRRRPRSTVQVQRGTAAPDSGLIDDVNNTTAVLLRNCGRSLRLTSFKFSEQLIERIVET